MCCKRSALPLSGHDGKALAHVLSTFPRDELFQISEDELLPTALSILNLGERPKVRVFLRFDKFDRFVSALVFLPRERYSGAVRERIHALLAKAFDGRTSAAMPMLDDEWLARIHYIVGRNEGRRPDVDVKGLESDIRAAIRTWDDGFMEAMRLRSWRTPKRAAAPLRGRLSRRLSRGDPAVRCGGRHRPDRGGAQGRRRRRHDLGSCLWLAGRRRERAALQAVRARKLCRALRLSAGVRESRPQGDRRADLRAHSAVGEPARRNPSRCTTS